MSSSIKCLLVKASVWFFQGDIQWRSQFLLSVDINSFTLAFAAVDGQQVVFIYLFLSWRIRNLSSHADLPGAPRRRRHRARKRSACKKKKKREATDGGVERMRGDTVCGQHLFIIDCCVELRGRDVHMTAWGNVLDAQCRVRADTHTFFFVVRSQINVAPIDWNLIGEVWTSSNFFLSFFCSIFKEASPDPSPHVGLTSPSAKTEAGYLTSCCFLWEKILIALYKCSWK